MTGAIAALCLAVLRARQRSRAGSPEPAGTATAGRSNSRPALPTSVAGLEAPWPGISHVPGQGLPLLFRGTLTTCLISCLMLISRIVPTPIRRRNRLPDCIREPRAASVPLAARIAQERGPWPRGTHAPRPREFRFCGLHTASLRIMDALVQLLSKHSRQLTGKHRNFSSRPEMETIIPCRREKKRRLSCFTKMKGSSRSASRVTFKRLVALAFSSWVRKAAK